MRDYVGAKHCEEIFFLLRTENVLRRCVTYSVESTEKLYVSPLYMFAIKVSYFPHLISIPLP
jgi:hypothetical protein